MLGRWALFVDAGWVFAAGTMSAFGEAAKRRDIIWDPAATVARLVAEAQQMVPDNAELLRTYWYDGSPNRLPLGDQHQIAALADVKLRLGRTVREGQKGVDGLIIHDLITLAYRSMISDAVVVSGDEDLLEAIESAQANGTRVHMLEIPIGGITDTLLNVVDRRAVLTAEVWTELFGGAPAPVDSQRPGSAPVASEGEQTVGGPVEARSAADGRTVQDQLPPPARRPKWMALPLLPSADEEDVSPVGREFAREWARHATPDELADRLADRPYLRDGLDGQLLRQASPNGEWLSDTQRRSLRDAFWTELASLGPAPSVDNR
jgi:hypothetical protein